MKLTLRIWRQPNGQSQGKLVEYKLDGVNPDMSFLEMLDELNEKLIQERQDPVAFDSDCREGICGTCGCMVNGIAHGPLPSTTICQLHMRHFKDGDIITVEPFRAKAFPLVKDLVINRDAFDRIIQAGGFISARTGSAPEANSTRIPKDTVDRAMDAATCIGCGACVAACPNASAMLFTAAKVSHLGFLPQGQPERKRRALRMVNQMDLEEFGGCTNIGECEAACPKDISLDFIARLNRDFLNASLTQCDKSKESNTF